MCGITGFNGPRPVDITKLRWLLRENENRGSDAAGVYADGVLFKKNMRATEFILLDGVNSTIKGKKSVQAHTRAATCGAKTDKNAHPFTAGDSKDPWYCVGSHNGFILTDLKEEHKALGFKETEFEVDSQLIFESIAKHKSFDILSKINGAIACAFMLPNQDPNMLFLYKNGEARDLHLGEATDGLYYSSAPGPLQLIGCTGIFSLKPHKIYCLKNGEIVDVRDVEAPLVRLASGSKRSNWKNDLDAETKRKLNISQPQTRDFQPATQGASRKLDTVTKTENYISSFQEDKDKLLALITQCSQDLKTMNITPLESVASSIAWSYDDAASGLLLVKMTDSCKNKPLIAWGVWLEDDIHVSGLTGISGCAVLKFPYGFCNKEVKLLLYDPTEHLAPRSIKLTVPAASVSEVSLVIPFRQEADGSLTIDNQHDNTEKGSDRSGQTEDTVYPSSPLNGKLHVTRAGVLKGEVRGDESSELRGSRASGKNIKRGVESNEPAEIPNTAAGTEVRTISTQLALPLKTAKIEDIKLVLEGKFKPHSLQFLEKLMAEPLTWHYKNLYRAKFAKTLLVDRLINKAVELKVMDEDRNKLSLALISYIRDLVMACPLEFATKDGMADGYMDFKAWLPENVLMTKNISEHQTALAKYIPVEEERMSTDYYYDFVRIRTMFKNHTMVVIKNEDKSILAGVKKHKECTDRNLGNLREAIGRSEHDLTASQLYLKSAMISARNHLKEESDDLADYIKLLENRIKDKASAPAESI